MEELQLQINKLQEELNLLKNSATIPFDVREAFRASLENNVVAPSDKDASTETQAVDEGGSATYSVAKPMDGFIKVTVNGVERKVPFYD